MGIASLHPSYRNETTSAFVHNDATNARSLPYASRAFAIWIMPRGCAII